MSHKSENSIIEALRNNPGGVGQSLSAEQQERIFLGPKNDPENQQPFDGDKFAEGLEQAFKNHPLEWMEMK